MQNIGYFIFYLFYPKYYAGLRLVQPISYHILYHIYHIIDNSMIDMTNVPMRLNQLARLHVDTNRIYI